MVIEFIILLILLFLSGFFSGTETAYTSITHIQIKKLKEKNRDNSALVEKLKDQSHKLITTILICNNLVNISASALATYLTIQLLGSQFIGVTTGFLTLLVLVFGEVSPKQLALEFNEFICLHTASLLKILMAILTPIIWIIDKLSKIITSLFIKGESKPKVTEADIMSAVELGEEIGELEPHEKRMIHNIFKFDDIEVEDIMIHRTDVFSLEENTKIKEIISTIMDKGYSRIPVYRKTKDNLVGVLMLKDLIPFLHKQSMHKKIKEIMVKPLFVPETRKVDDMLRDFKKEKNHIAIVIDENGGFSGIVTVEDVIEEIVGEIYDETDKVVKSIKRINKNTFMIKGDTEITSVNKRLKLRLSEDENFETIARYILRRTGKIPRQDQEIKLRKGKFIITKVKNNRIESIKYVRK
jgi:putative hemolysin